MSDVRKQKNKQPFSTGITVTILGSGTCVPSLRRSACAVLMETGGTKLLLDCGPGTMRRLLEAGVAIFDISFVFLSHFHPDHSGELASFLFSNKCADGNRRDTPLTIIAGRGFSHFYEGLKGAYGHWIALSPELLNIIELDKLGNDGQSFGDFTLESAPMVHNPESLAYRITSSDGMSVVYSGDTDVSENLVTLAREADILICESALPDALKVSGHLTPSLAGEIASRAGVGKLVLTHFYPECDAADIEAECRKTYAGPLFLAEDLMRIVNSE
ncbi:MAG: MBL fold metallo-hydrolase [Desulfobacteraceae bacterium 4572_88]|nr:MAG: MBL fold metallo-hydrolase [Desulfobacteraceae bacterium 4572_88]